MLIVLALFCSNSVWCSFYGYFQDIVINLCSYISIYTNSIIIFALVNFKSLCQRICIKQSRSQNWIKSSQKPRTGLASTIVIARGYRRQLFVVVVVVLFVSFIFLVGGQLLYNIVVVFAIHWYESAMDLHVVPILIPPPTSIPIPSLWVFPVHQP